MTRLFITTHDIAAIRGCHIETVRREARAGLYDKARFKGGKLRGGGSKPYQFRTADIEKQLGLAPGTISAALSVKP
jgi:hypothetical protein